MLDCLNYIKKYQPLIKTIRVKGLTQRHWRQINAELNLTIDPQSTTLLRLIGLGLFAEDRISIIKGISDIALKEYSVQVQTEQLDAEVKAVKFEIVYGAQLSYRVVKRPQHVQTLFAEFMLKVGVLKMNPYMRSFFDRLLEIEKICKQVLEIMAEFVILQNKWVYLQKVFDCELPQSLASEIKIWKVVDKFFCGIIRGMFEAPQVYKLTFKDGFLQMLRKNNTELDQCKEGIFRFLELKRQAFPRLYFVSNEELLFIYGKQTECIDQLIQGEEKTFIQTIYQGVIQLRFNQERRVIAVSSFDGEFIQLEKPIVTSNQPIEKWLFNLENMLMESMKAQILCAYQDMDKDQPTVPEDIIDFKKFKQTQTFQTRVVNAEVLKEWIARWPGQATYLSMQVWFNQKILSVFQGSIEKAKSVDQLRRNRERERQLQRVPNAPQSDTESANSDLYASEMTDDDERPNQ